MTTIQKCLSCHKPDCDNCVGTRRDKHNKNAEIVGENLKRIMKEKNLSNIRLGEMCGVDRRTISGYRHGKKMPRKDIMLALCEALECTVEELTQSS